jgi:hypothetical protein
MAEIYRSGEVMKWFTMMTGDLSAKWNRLSFDMPAAVRNGHYLYFLADLTSFAISGLAIALMSGALGGDDEEKKKARMIAGLFSQYTEAIPMVGQDLFSMVQEIAGVGKSFQSGGVKFLPAMTYATRIPAQIKRGDWGKALENLAEGTAMGLGLPMSGPRRAVKAVVDGDWTQLLGWPSESKE